MTDNGTIEISVGGKLVQLTPQQIAVVSQKIQEKYNYVYQYLKRKKMNRIKIILKNLPYLIKFSLNR